MMVPTPFAYPASAHKRRHAPAGYIDESRDENQQHSAVTSAKRRACRHD